MLKCSFDLAVGDEADRFHRYLYSYIERCPMDLAPLQATRMAQEGREHRIVSFPSAMAVDTFSSGWTSAQPSKPSSGQRLQAN